ncbi:hypothetical protein [Paraburkholderia sp.]|uniref:hypothetical protein n=1 Tax=Paraburkholderia sp. TaxID=1926495 RepID=UPI0025D2A273|nr:hypothetical protein [Paraburkholderia sp.]
MTQPEHNHPHQSIQRGVEIAGEEYMPTYWSLLQEPMLSLARNPSDRPDVMTAAILGYN